MAESRRLKNAPITEALIDIRVAPRADVDIRTFIAARERLNKKFEVVEERKDSRAVLNFLEGGKVSADSEDLGLQGVVFKTKDLTRAIQFRRDGFTLNHLKPYESWESMLPEALDAYQVYESIAQPSLVVRIAVRYINRITFATHEFELDDYLLVGPKFPERIPDDFTAWMSRIVYLDKPRELNAIAAMTLEQRLPTELPSLVFDIDAFKTKNVAGNLSGLRDQFEQLRSYKNNIFFGSLTETLVSRYDK